MNYPKPCIAVCAAAGEVDYSTAPMLRGQLYKAITERARHVVADLSAVTFFSAAGVSALRAARAVQAQDQQLVLVATGRPVVRVLDICEVGYPRYRRLDHALAACDEASSP